MRECKDKISVVIPVYNEVGTIEELLSCVQTVPLDKEIIIIDDGSTGGTRELLKAIGQSKNVQGLY
jgi:glycosyltransferase involved in cell wall biosynthesis